MMTLDTFILILSMLALGKFFSRLKVFPENTSAVLNQVVIYLCLPASVLLYVSRLHPEWSLFGLMAMPWLIALVTSGILIILRKRLGFRREEYAVLLLCVTLGNTGFIGYPMTRALLGETALSYAVIYDQFGTFLMLSTFGLYVCARYDPMDHASPGFSLIVKRILYFPPTQAMIFGLTLMPADPPAWIAYGLKSLSEAMLPLVMLAMGFSLRFQLPRDEIRALSVGLFLKLILLPLLAWGISLLTGLSGMMLRVSVLETAMPPMITAAVLAMSHHLAPRLAAAMVGYGIFLSLISLPVWAIILA